MIQRTIRAAGALALVAWAGAAGAQTLTVVGRSHFGPSDCQAGLQASIQFSFQTTGVNIPGNAQLTILLVPGDNCPAVGSSDTTVATPDGGVVLVPLHTVTSQDVAGTTSASVRTMAFDDCSAVQTKDWSVCAYDFFQIASGFGSVQNSSHSASTALTYDSAPPGAPLITSVTSGDQHFHVAFNAPSDSDVDHFDIIAVPASSADAGPSTAASTSATTSGATGGTSTGSSGATSTSASAGSTGSTGATGGTSTGSSGGTSASASAGSTGGSTGAVDGGAGNLGFACVGSTVLARFENGVTGGVIPDASGALLENGVVYAVQVRAVDTAGNVGPCSNVVLATPQQVDDFWRAYRDSGGKGTGGCSQAGGGIMLLAALGALALLGRTLRGRKERA